jgi:thiosulfate dehydrogenase
LFGPQ